MISGPVDVVHRSIHSGFDLSVAFTTETHLRKHFIKVGTDTEEKEKMLFTLHTLIKDILGYSYEVMEGFAAAGTSRTNFLFQGILPMKPCGC